MGFAEHCSTNPEGYSKYLSNLLSCNERVFCINGVVNKQNVKVWGVGRPDAHSLVFMRSPGVMKWWAIWNDCVIGHYVLESENYTGKSYENMYYTFPSFSSLREDKISKQDCFPSHYSNQATTYLNIKRPKHWILWGICGLPARSPDLNPSDFLLWGLIKSKMVSTPIGSMLELKAE